VLWLDGDRGIELSARGAQAWIDRSEFHHVIAADLPVPGEDPASQGPTLTTLAGHGALQFGGGKRLQLAPGPNDAARAALTIGTSDFAIAIVEKPEGQPVDPTDAADRPSWLFGLMPEIRSGTVGPDLLTMGWAFGLLLGTSLHVQLWEGPRIATNLVVDRGGPYLAPAARLLVISATGPRVEVRINGETYFDSPSGRLANNQLIDMPFASVYVGAWDWDQPSFAGDVAEVVVIKGTGVSTAQVALEGYLRKKYAL
jgi:hypothetical protein